MLDTLPDKTAIPVPSDINTEWEPPLDMDRPLTPFQEALILSVCPPGSHILSARFHRLVRLPCPIWVRVALPVGKEQRLILRMDQSLHGVEKEARLLPVLARLGLLVPSVLAGPTVDPAKPGMGTMSILTVLSGRDLLGWSWNAPAESLELAMRLVLEGVKWLHALTAPLSREPEAELLPRVTLDSELQGIIKRGGSWFQEPVFSRAMESLLPIVENIRTPLVFSTGDYNPGNFLFEGDALTGFIDFTGACFEDPHIGFAKYWTYSWYPLDRAGIVERYLAEQQLPFTEFAPRLAVRCLWTLQREIAVSGGEDKLDEDEFETHADFRNRILDLLQRAMDAL